MSTDSNTSRGKRPDQPVYQTPAQKKKQKEQEQKKERKEADHGSKPSKPTDRTTSVPDTSSPQNQGQERVQQAKEKKQLDKPEPSKSSSQASKKPFRPQGTYVPGGLKKQREEDPEMKSGYLHKLEASDHSIKKIHKPYNSINIGDVLMGPSHNLSLFVEKIGTAKELEAYSSKLRTLDNYNDIDTTFHPQIVIGKSIIDNSVQTVVLSTFGLEEGESLADKENLDYEVACKYHVPMEGHSHELHHREKGQPGFTGKYEGEIHRLTTQTGNDAPGWACTFMFLIIGTSRRYNYELPVLDGVKVSDGTIHDLQRAIDDNESERKKFIEDKYDAFVAKGVQHNKIKQFISRTKHISLPTRDGNDNGEVASNTVSTRGGGRGRDNSSRNGGRGSRGSRGRGGLGRK